MKAIRRHQYGGPEILQFSEIPVPKPKDDEVLVKVHATSINSWDWDLLTGKPYIYRLIFGLPKPRIKILGADVAGVVESMGKNVNTFKPGDRVFGDVSACHWGGLAEYLCAKANMLATIPPGMSYVEAAAIPQAGVLALQSLRSNGDIQPGQKVLINGAGGGVGTFAIQMAKDAGAEVNAVDHGSKLELMHSLGADHVIDYTKADFTKCGKTFDFIIDVVARHFVRDYTRLLSPGGYCSIVGGQPGKLIRIALFGAWLPGKGRKVRLLMHRPNATDLNVLSSLFLENAHIPVIDTVYPLEQAAEAMRHFGSGLVKGKLVIQVQE